MDKKSSTLSGKALQVGLLAGLFMPLAADLSAQASQKKLSDQQVSQLMSTADKRIAFVENKGQWPAHVLYRADVPGGQMLATPDGMLIGLFDRSSMHAISEYDMKMEEIQAGKRPGMTIRDLGPAPSLKGFGWRLNFSGGAKAAAENIEREGENADYYNYLTANPATEATNVHSYGVITYKDVYQGIDVKYYTSPKGDLENDIVVKPGADANKLNIMVEGIDELKTGANGALILPTTLGNISIPNPVSYLLDATGQRTEISIKYHLTGKNSFAFDIPAYDKQKTLVIDPIVMRWATWIASNSNVASHCHGVDLDASGNIYVVSRGGNGFVATTGEFQTAWDGTGNAENLWLSKFVEPTTPGQSGTIVWQTYLGGASTTNPYACVVGSDGYLYIDGLTNQSLSTTYGTGAPTPGWTQRAVSSGGQQVFVAKVAPSGAWAEVRDIGTATGNQDPYLFDLRVLPTGTSTFDLIAAGYVTQQSGSSANGDIPVAQYPNGTMVTTGSGNINGYVLRITSDLNTIKWTKQYTSSGDTNKFAISVVDGSGNILLGGLTKGASNISYNNTTQSTLTGTQDGWLMSLDSANGSANWSRYFNSSAGGKTSVLCMEVNQQKTQFVIGGLTDSLSSANISAGAYQRRYPGSHYMDFFIASIPIAGTATTWGTYFGGNGSNTSDNMMGLNIDQNNDVYVLGYTNSKFTPTTIPAQAYPVQNDAYDATDYDAIFFKLSGSTGDTLDFYTFLGGKSEEEDPVGERGIKFNNCRIYLAITSESDDFPLTTGTLDSVYSGSSVYLPIIVSMANPPDLLDNGISTGGNQTITCGQTPQAITAAVPSYIIPAIIRDKVRETNSTTAAYPNGLPQITSYQWQYSTNQGLTWTSIAGATGQNYTPTAIDSFTGVYEFRRIIDNDACNRASDTLAIVKITVNPPYSAPNITTNSPICVGQTLDLNTNAQSGYTYSWTGPNGFTSRAQDTTVANVTAASTGYYYLTVKNTSNGCPSYPDSSLVSTTTALLPPTVSSDSPVCSGNALTLSASGQPSATFSWTGPNGFTSNSATPTVSSHATVSLSGGSYCATQTAGCTSPQSCTIVTVDSTPNIISAVDTNPTTCGGANGSITISGLTASQSYSVTYSEGGTGAGPITLIANSNGKIKISGLNAGTYTNIVVKLGTCSSAPFAGPLVISNPSAPPAPALGSNSPVCSGDTIKLRGTPAQSGAVFSWTGPLSYTSSSDSPSITNATTNMSGSYCATQTVAGCLSGQTCTPVTVNPTPVIGGSASTNPATCGGATGTITLTGLTADSIYSVSYKLNSVSQGPITDTANISGNVVISHLAAGSYTGFVLTLHGCPSAPFGGTITLSNPATPAPPKVGNNGPVCSGNILTLADTGVAGATFTWTGPNGYTHTGANPTVSSAAITALSGNYCATQTDSGCTGTSACTTVVVDSTPAITGATGQNPLTCGGTNGSVTLSGLIANKIYSVTYQKNGGSQGPITDTANGSGQLVIKNLTIGTYSNIIVSVSPCSSPAAGPVTLANPSGPNPPTATTNAPVCAGFALTVGVNATAGATYRWTGPLSFNSNAEDTTVSSAAITAMSGAYKVIVTLNGCADSSTVNVTVNGNPSVTAGPGGAYCSGSGDSVILGGNPTASGGGGSYTYGWTPTAGLNSSSAANPVAKPLSSTPYTVIVTDNNGCKDTAGATVTVNPTPTVSAGPSGGDTICAGSSIMIGGNPTAQNGTPLYSYSWNNGASAVANPTVSPVITTTYSLTVTDAHSCSGTASVTVLVHSGVTASAGNNVTLSGCSPTGIAIGGSPTASGGTAPVTYLWSPLAGLSSDTSANPVVKGISNTTTYSVTVTDANSCTASAQTVVTVVSNTPSVSISSSGKLSWCASSGSSDNLTANINGGTSPYSYSWSGTDISPTNADVATVNPNVSGTYPYSVTVTDNFHCTATASTSVTVNPKPAASAGPGGFISCSGAPVTIGGSPTASGGTPGYTYSWSGGAAGVANPSVSPLNTATYQVTVTDTLSCTASASTVVTVHTLPIASAGPPVTLPSCSPTGLVIGGSPTASGGSGSGYSYAWSPTGGLSLSTDSNPTVQGIINTTTYTVTVTDGNACTASAQVVVTVVNNTPSVSISSSGSLSWCASSGSSDNLTSNINGGTSPYSYSWSGTDISPTNAIVATVNPNVSGTYAYSVTVTDNFNCTASATTSVTVNPIPGASAGPGGFVSCSGAPVTIGGSPTASGGTPGYTYSWSGGAAGVANPSVSPLTTTTYQVTVTDTLSCTASASTVVTVHTLPTASAGPPVTLPSCSPTGIVIGGSPTASGGSGSGYFYAWAPSTGLMPDSAVSNPTVQGISNSTTYSVTVTDGNTCTASAQMVVTVSNNTPSASISSSGSETWCAGSSSSINLTANVSGGTSSYSYSWSGSSIAPVNASVAAVNPNTSGTYTYEVTVTDAFNCTATASAAVTVNAIPTASAGPAGGFKVCDGSSVMIGGSNTASGGTSPYSYAWNNGAGPVANPVVNPTSNTSYTVTVTDHNSCTASAATSVLVNPTPGASAGPNQAMTACDTTGVLIGGLPTGSGGTAPLTYSWSPGAGLSSDTTADPTVKGIGSTTIYTVIVSDSNQCVASSLVKVTITGSTLAVNISSNAPLTWCTGGTNSTTLTANASGGSPLYSYAWTGHDLSRDTSVSTIANPDTAGNYLYSVVVTDANGCQAGTSTTITVNPTPLVQAENGPGYVICDGSGVTLGGSPTASGGLPPYSYSWTGGAAPDSTPTVSPSGTTTYTLTVTDANSCSATSSTTVTVNNNPTANAGSDETVQTCSPTGVKIGGSPTASGGGGSYTYAWSPSVALTNTNTSNPFVIGLPADTSYTVVVTDINTCSASAEVRVTASNSSPSVSISSSGSTSYCSNSGTGLNFTANVSGGTPGYNYNWSGTDITPLNSSTATVNPSVPASYIYNVTVTDAQNCTASATKTVIVDSVPAANAGADSNYTICAGGTVVIGSDSTASGGTGPYTYAWSGGAAPVANPSVSPSTTTVYTVTVTDHDGCTATATATVTVNSNPTASAGSTQSVSSCSPTGIVIGGSPTASGGSPGYAYSWSPITDLSSTTIANPTVMGLTHDTTYIVIVTDSKGCSATSGVLIHGVNTSPSVSISSSGSTSYCSNSGTGLNFTANVSGGTPGYNYNWSGTDITPLNSSAATVNPSVPASYIYNVTVTDAQNCTGSATKTVIVDSVPMANAGADSNYTICAGSSVIIGSDSTASGGTGPYTYAWSAGAAPVANPTVSPSSTTVYTVTVTDHNGCTATATATVTINSNPIASAGSTQSVSSCSPTGIVIGGSPTASGGSPGYAYSWSPINDLSSATIANPTVMGLTHDTTYTVIVTDNKGCSATSGVLIHGINTSPSVSISSNGSTSYCANSGTSLNFTANVSGGTPGYNYNWSGTDITPLNSSGATVNPSVPASYIYNVTVTDAQNCTGSATKTVIVDSVPVANAGTLNEVVCSGTTVTLGGSPTAKGGTPPYSYSWSSGAAPVANPGVTPLTTTTYTLMVMDSNGCTATASNTVTVHPAPVASAGPNKTLPTCSPSGIQIGGTPTASGGGGAPFSYTWSPSTGLSSIHDANPIVLGISSNTLYTVVVTDSNSCTASAQAEVTVSGVSPSVSVSASSSTQWCAGSNRSSNLTANVTGATSPLAYSWSGSNITPTNAQVATVNPNAPGSYSYTVTVTDANNCTAQGSKTVIVDSVPRASASAAGGLSTCAGYSITLGGSPTASGGSGSYTYAWSGGASPVANPVVTPANSISYTVTVTDSNGCTATASAPVTVNPNPTASAGPNVTLPSCSPTGVQIGGTPTASGGIGPYTYNWSPPIRLTSSTSSNPTVQGITSTTTYTVVVTDSDKCSASAEVTVTVVNTGPGVAITSSSDTEWCAGTGGSTNLTANVTGNNGTLLYSWSGTDINPTNSSTATVNPSIPDSYNYSVTVMDASNCTASASKTIVVDSVPVANGGGRYDVCSGTPITLGGSPTAKLGNPGYTYLWSGATGTAANPVIIPTSSGVYTVTVTDSKGCTATSSANVTVKNIPVANAGLSPVTLPACSPTGIRIGGSPTASGGSGGPYSYRWSPDSGLSDTAAANPTVVGINANTTYTVTVTDAGGCTASAQVTVIVTHSSPVVNIIPSGNTEWCAASYTVITLTAGVSGGSSPFTYSWSGTHISPTNSSVATVDANTQGTYIYAVTVTDGFNCTTSATETVKVDSLPAANAGIDTVVCSGGSVRIGGTPTASGGTAPYTYSWSPTQSLSAFNAANPVASPTVITTYELTVTDSKGCTAVDAVTVSVNSNPVVNAGPNQSITNCPGDTVCIGGFPDVTSGGSAPFRYFWTPGTNLSNDTIASPCITGLTQTTSYQLLVTDSNGCKGNAFVVLDVVPSTLQASAGNNQTICGNSSFPAQIGGAPTAVGGTPPYSFNWSPATGLNNTAVSNPSALPASTTTYYLTVTDSKGCSSFDSVKVNINPAPAANAGDDTAICDGFPVALGGNPTASGGTPAYQYSWLPTTGLNSNNIANPTAFPSGITVYTLTVTDSAGCKAFASITVSVNANPVANAGPDVTLTACPDDSVTLGGSPAASGGTPGYTYAWLPAAGLNCDTCPNPWLKHIPSSTFYTLTVTDSNGCVGTDQALAAVIPGNLQAHAGNGGAYCQGTGTGIALGGVPTAVGGTPGYTYTWFPATGLNSTSSPNPVADPLVSTWYYLTVTDAKGCMAVDSVHVIVYQSMIVNAGDDTTICNGLTVQLGGNPTVRNGLSPYSYSWSPGTGLSSNAASNPFATPTSTTIYEVTVTGRTGCTATGSVTVNVNPNPVACAGPGGSIFACTSDSIQLGCVPSASGGSAPYTYLWSPTGGLSCDTCSNPFVNHLGSSTTFGLVVTDSNGCSSSASYAPVTVKGSGLTVNPGNNASFCQGTTVSVTLGGSPTATGGTGTITYVWSPATGLSSTSSPNPNASPVVTTTYYVVATDGAGCIAEDSVNITIHPAPIANAGSPDTVCLGTQVQLGGTPTGSGGSSSSYHYSWSPGLYFVSSDTAANPSVEPTSNIIYSVVVTDSLGCTGNSSISIRVNQNPVASAGGNQTLAACPLACVSLGGAPTASGGTVPYSYAWSPASGLNNTGLANPQACNLSASATYQLTVTDVNGCTATSQASVNVVPSSLTVNAGNDQKICQGSSTGVIIGGTPSASGGTGPYVYDWSPSLGILTSGTVPNPRVNPTDTTTYILLVQDALGCTALDSVTIYVDPAVGASVNNDTSICSGGNVAIGGNPTGSGGTSPYSYLWSPGTGLTNVSAANPVASPSTSTTFCVTVTDVSGCTASTCQTIDVNPSITACAGPAGGFNITNCPGSFAQIGCTPTATGGSGNYSYSWSPDNVNGVTVLNGSTVPNPIVTGLTVTTLFTVTVTDNATGCTATAEVDVNVSSSTLTANAGNNQVFCAGSTICLTIGGNPSAAGGASPYQYAWSPVAGINNPSIANPCVMPTVTTNYLLTVTDRLGCEATDSVMITVDPQITVDAGNDTSVCSGQSVMLGGNPGFTGGTGPYIFSWSPSLFLTSTDSLNPVAQNLTSNATYTLLVSDAQHCSATGNISINVRALPAANAGPPVNIYPCNGDSAVLGGSPTGTGTVGPYTYSWAPPLNLSLSCLTCPNPVVQQLGHNTQFCVTVTDTFGCTASSCVDVTVLPNTVFANAVPPNLAPLCASTIGACETLGGIPPATGGVPGYTYDWSGGQVSDSTAPHPQACPLMTTTYILVVTDNKGCQAVDSVTVIVNNPPVVTILGLDSQYCVTANNVTMTGIPSGGTFSGAGVSGNIFQPSIAGPGLWCITYSYSDPSTGCAGQKIICTRVNALPAVDITGYSSNGYCQSDGAVPLTGTPSGGVFSGPGMSGNLFYPDSATIGNNTITYSYTNPSTGCSNSAQVIINVKANPTISISASVDTACSGQPVTITPAFSFDVFNIVWTQLGGGNLGSGLNPIVVNPTGTNYCVVATAINTPNGCISRDTACIDVYQPPVIIAPVAVNTCENQPDTVNLISTTVDPQHHPDVANIIVPPLHGTLVSVGDTIYIYTPVPYFHGQDSFKYSVCNSRCSNTCDTATALVSVCYVAYPPVIVDTTITIYENDSAHVCPDIYDYNGLPLVIGNAACDTLHGQLIFTSDSCLEFIPTANWIGVQVLCITVCDTGGLCDTGTVTVHVIPSNHPPVAYPEQVYTCTGTPIGVNVSRAAIDPNGNPLSFSYGTITGPGAATWVTTSSGAQVFVASTPGVYTIPYYVCNQSLIPPTSLCDSSFITVTVIACDSVSHDSIAANNDAGITNVGVPIVINELANDYYPYADSLTVTIISGPDLTGSTAVLDPAGEVIYQSPTPGIDTIEYQICDPAPLCATALIIIYVDTTPSNIHYPPVAVDDYDSTNYLTPVTMPVLSNDHSPSGDSIHTTAIVCQPGEGTASLNVNGTITYTPNATANACRPDTFCYRMCDVVYPALCDSAQVVIYIRPSLVAVNDSAITGQHQSVIIHVLSNDRSPDCDSFSVSSVITAGTVGTVIINPNGTVTYLPVPDTCGFIDSFRYIDTSAFGAIDTATVYVTVICCPTKLVAVPDTESIQPGDSLVFNPAANDIDSGAILTYQVITPPSHGHAYYLNDSTLVYVPNTGFCGFDHLQYLGSGQCGTDTGDISVHVICRTPPYTPNDTVDACINTPVNVNVFANDTAEAGYGPLSITNVGNPLPGGLGEVTGVSGGIITYAPYGITGTVTLPYTVCDSGQPPLCSTGTIIINIAECQKPIVDTIYDTTLINTTGTACIGVYVNAGGNPWYIDSLCNPMNGTDSIGRQGDTCIVYVPNLNFSGNDTFCIVVCDTFGCTGSEVIYTVIDTIIKANPIYCDQDTVPMNVPDTLHLLAYDTIPRASDTAITITEPPTNGQATLGGNHTVIYLPNDNYRGTDEFVYQVCAITGSYKYCDTASVCLTIVDTTHHCIIPDGFSPNGDGVNDVYVIPCNELYPAATLEVFSRWGDEVWSSNGPYKNNWDGKNQNWADCPTGTYFIIYNYNDGIHKSVAQFVVLNR